MTKFSGRLFQEYVLNLSVFKWHRENIFKYKHIHIMFMVAGKIVMDI